MIKKLIAAVVVLAVVAGAGFWWFVLREDTPEKLSIDDSVTQTTGAGVPTEIDGTWTVAAKGDTQAGLRIKESFASGLVDHVAVGRSSEVTGSIELSGPEVTEGRFVVDLTALEFTDAAPLPVANRAGAMRNRGLETSTFPSASFKITKPIDLGGKPVDGKKVSAKVTGDLLLHGVSKSVTFEVEALLAGNSIQVATKDPVPIKLADFDIEKPTGGPIADISDEGSFEFRVVFTKR